MLLAVWTLSAYESKTLTRFLPLQGLSKEIRSSNIQHFYFSLVLFSFKLPNSLFTDVSSSLPEMLKHGWSGQDDLRD